MAKVKDENIDKAPAEASKQETPDKEAALSKEEKDDWGKIVDGKFKTEAELAKAYKDLESKLGEQGEEIRQSREFATVVQPLLETIRDDPELFSSLEKKLQQKGQTSDAQTAKGNEKVANQDELRTTASDLILARFEEKHGIDRLPASERKELRQKIGDTIYDLTGKPLTSVDLRRLGAVLDNAYILANKDKLMEKSKLEALVSARGVEEAGIPSIPSSPGKAEETLTPEETRVAEKMGLTREQYLDGKKKSGRGR